MPRSLGTATAPALASAPAVGVAGALYYNTGDGTLYKSDGAAWSAVGGSGGGPTVSDTAPGSPTSGMLWFESDTGILWVYYDSFWIEVGGGIGGFIVSDTAPSSPISGMGWFKSDTGQSYVYYDSTWVEMAGGPPGPIGQSTLPWTKTGTLSVTTGSLRFPMPFDGTILGISARVGTAPTGASILVDVNKNGTTIFTTQGNRPAILAGANATAAEVTNMEITSFIAGDYLTVDIDQVGSTVAGSDLTVVIRYRDNFGAVAELPGMVLITKQDFTAASTFSVNGCFTTAYENYRIVLTATGSTTAQGVALRMRASGADDSTASSYTRVYNIASGSTATINSATGTSATDVIAVSSAGVASSVIDLLAPAIASATSGVASGYRPEATASFHQVGFRHSVATAFDGFTLFPASGTFTGTVRIYGLRN